MSDIAIKVENLGKRYQLGLTHDDLFANRLVNGVKRLIGRAPQTDAEELWALKDVSFEVKQGDVVGIIGRNGAGKSTLLKILSRITKPTTGKVEINGRVASLLEVGTGFHPELTGRENIFLNGAILGMTRAEIKTKFDEIVDFAEIEKFIETPVKRYSSGMYVRLAFAVAAHLEPEILVVDEVLAVGDAQFQKKCLGKMKDVAGQGRTVLFVSHNMNAVRSLCKRGLVLDKGGLIEDNSSGAAVTTYNQAASKVSITDLTEVNNPTVRRGTGAARFTTIKLTDPDGTEKFTYDLDETVTVKLCYSVKKNVDNLYASLVLRSSLNGETVTSVRRTVSQELQPAGNEGEVVFVFPIDQLRAGEYLLYFWLGDEYSVAYDVIDNLTLPLTVKTSKEMPELGYDPAGFVGYFNLQADFELRKSIRKE